MRILRLLAAGVSAGASILVIGFVCADRLAHTVPSPVARIVLPEPSATGSIPAPEKPVAAVKPAPAKIPNGFDTERLNALMRGDPILPTKR
ncbi:hypothetical protein FV232_04315 [Methylobacterium sp. WL30]|uniref:hypothetical protein n=1 Tax=unclassified Methylobacterium TaxID=2615210 RepID=UPI0011CA272A|nr:MULTISPECIES: hypothetical protein [unclassified Methylobacterium]MCJ2039616.1 hypothetical protein [Methylobacterium sp. J-059]MCJ2077444.1 hypothetical protein [Methylobacterium sp. E-016]MCJ2113942.1 hypothetical protein [Methylobacterium sp. E-025]TXM91614.1 hypothetical protein FV223_14615 [Methylobacterium sp. WL116]TXN30218.1 hypothetical protein FV225_20350 [Methylobacterium sp. WL93]